MNAILCASMARQFLLVLFALAAALTTGQTTFEVCGNYCGPGWCGVSLKTPHTEPS